MDSKIITTQLNQIIELKIFELYKSLMEKKKAFISSFDLQGKPDTLLDSENLKQIKKNFKI